MAVLNFPKDDPTGTLVEGMTYELNGITYVYTSAGGGDARWQSEGNGSVSPGASVEVGPTPPASAGMGDLWFNTNDGRLYIWYEDTDTEQWVDASPSGGSGGGSGGGSINSGPTFPSTGTVDELFFNTTDGRLYIYYYDGSSYQWVDASPDSQSELYWDRTDTTLSPSNAGDDVDLGNIQLNADGTGIFSQDGDSRTVDLSIVKTSGEGVGDNGGIALGLTNNGSVATGRSVGMAFRPGTGFGSPARGWINYVAGSGAHTGEFHFDVRTTNTGVDATALRITSEGDTLCQYWQANTTSQATNAFITGQGGIRRVTSAARYKTNVRTLSDAFSDKALELRPVVFNSLCELDDPSTDYLGFIAEEVVALFPEIGTYEEDGTVSGVQYDRVTPMLVNLIQRQNTRIEALEAKVTQLEGGN